MLTDLAEIPGVAETPLTSQLLADLPSTAAPAPGVHTHAACSGGSDPTDRLVPPLVRRFRLRCWPRPSRCSPSGPCSPMTKRPSARTPKCWRL
jgi:hypothetical protein